MKRALFVKVHEGDVRVMIDGTCHSNYEWNDRLRVTSFGGSRTEVEGPITTVDYEVESVRGRYNL